MTSLSLLAGRIVDRKTNNCEVSFAAKCIFISFDDMLNFSFGEMS